MKTLLRLGFILKINILFIRFFVPLPVIRKLRLLFIPGSLNFFVRSFYANFINNKYHSCANRTTGNRSLKIDRLCRITIVKGDKKINWEKGTRWPVRNNKRRWTNFV